MAGLAFEENVAVNEAINDMATEVERIVNLFGSRMARALTS